MLASIYAYRGFLFGAAKRDFQAKYRGSLLGCAWTLLNPIAMIFVYTVVFSRIMPMKFGASDSNFSYGAYICTGVLTWGLFIQIIDRMLGMFINNANLVKKVNFPRICLPILAVLGAVVDFTLVFGLFSAFLLVTGQFPGLSFLATIPLLAILVALAVGLGVALGTINVFFRDTEQVFRVAAQFWFWLTPVVYPLAILPDAAQTVVGWNPLTPVMIGLQGALVGGLWPDWGTLIYPGALAGAACLLGVRLFRRHAGDIADEL
jgi:lipopolysaccharide transport system permease protein